MELILHLGAHRTGTTALQSVLEARPQLLRAAGMKALGPAALREVNWRLPDPAAGVRRLILSDENLIGTMYGNFLYGALYPRAAIRLRELAGRLPSVPDTIYFAVRDYAEYWVSAWSHTMLFRRIDAPDAARLEATAEGRGWTAVLGTIVGAFPAARVRVWRYSTAPGMVPGMVAALLGTRLARRMPAPEQGVNASLSAEALDEYWRGRRPAGEAREGNWHAEVVRLRARSGSSVDLFGATAQARMKMAFEAEWLELERGALAGVETFDPVSLAA